MLSCTREATVGCAVLCCVVFVAAMLQLRQATLQLYRCFVVVCFVLFWRVVAACVCVCGSAAQR